MNKWSIELLIIGLILLIGTASALMPTKIIITSSADSDSHQGWLVANGVDQTTITIKVDNDSLILPSPNTEPVDQANVNLFVDPFYGSLTDTMLVTNPVGEARTIFTANRTSNDTLVLNVRVSNPEGQKSATKIIKIDHGQAYYAVFNYKDEIIVDQTTPFVVTLNDYWGNRVDNKNTNKIHTAKFRIYPPPGGLGTGGLKNATSGYLPVISVPTDATGTISLTAKVDTVAGENNIWMERIESIPDKYPFIVGITQAPPYYIDSVVAPSGDPGIPADTTSVFTIQYTLRDKFRNPAANQTARIFTSANESIGSITSNSMGQIWVTYGPKSQIGEFNITAVAIENATVSCSDIVKFYSTDPVSMVVTANPQMMPSRDVPGSQPAQISAKIMDILGNPVEGETVTFTIPGGGITNSTILTKRPSFSSSLDLQTISETTDVDGNAIASLYAGEFPISGSKYSSNATGTATILSTWAGKSMPITVTFKNYPYLRVEASVIPQVVNVSGTFDVDLKLIGDGWKLQSKDIDVFLVFDRSGSMGSDSPTRISQAQTATTTFLDQMTSRDQAGLVSFSSSATTDNTLTNNFASIKTKINSLTASGSTQLRNAIYKAINNLKVDGRDGAVKAVIVMTDGNWNLYGTPLGHGTGWPSNNNDYTFSGSNLEPNNYYYYDGLGGTLTSYESCSVTGCSIYSTTVCDNYGDACDTCASGYTLKNGKCCSGKTCKWPADQPSWCSVRHCDQWHCNVLQTTCQNKYKCTDGEFTEQNMSIYAKDNGIRLYTISFAETLDPVAVNAMQVMADNTGAFYQHAPTGADLRNIYLQIAGELRTLAGVNTIMDLSFQNVNVTYNNVTTSMEGKNVFAYIYQSGESTWVTSWNKTQNPLPDHVPKPPTPPYTDVLPNSGSYTTYPYSYNQMNEWLSSSALNFNAGNITINQTWETKFRFRVNATGNIDIFGPGSKIIFNNGESYLELPHTYITAVPNLTNAGMNATILDVSNLHSTTNGTIKDFIPLEWNIHYDGNQMVTERISYSYDGGLTWVLFDTNYVTKGTLTDYSSLDVRLLPPGEYWIRVDANAPDAPSDRETILAPGITVGTKGRSYIKLE